MFSYFEGQKKSNNIGWYKLHLMKKFLLLSFNQRLDLSIDFVELLEKLKKKNFSSK